MKTCYFLLFFFFIPCLISRSLAQNSVSTNKTVHFELSSFVGELQIKNHLFKGSPFGERAGVGYGGDVVFGITYKNGWGINIGVQYLSQVFTTYSSFDVRYSNPNNAATSSDDFYVNNLNNSFSNYDVTFTLQQFGGASCDNPAAPLQDGETLRFNLVRVNPLQQISLPIKLEKTLGKNRNKLYLGLGVVPICVISNPQSAGKYRQTNQVLPHDYSRSRCYIGNNVLRQIVVFRSDLIFKNQNIEDFRVDLTTEFGLLNEGAKNTFKLILFYNESLAGFTQVDEIKYHAQTVGIKFALRKSFHRK